MRGLYFTLAILAGSLIAMGQDSDKEARNTLANAGYTGLENLKLTTSFTTKHNGVVHYYFEQEFQGYPVFNSNFAAHISDGKLITVDDQRSKKPSGFTPTYELNGAAIIASAARETELMGEWVYDITKANNLNPTGGEVYNAPDGVLAEPVEVNKGIYVLGKEWVSVYRVMLIPADHSHFWYVYVNATTGDVVDKSDLVISCDFSENTSERSKSLAPNFPAVLNVKSTAATQAVNSYEVFPFPLESPNHGSRKVVVDPADTGASPYGWHDINGQAGYEYTYTRGNNVWARDDINADNSGGNSVDGGTDLEFSAFYNDTVSAENMLDAAIINLFYWNNLMHDVWYQYGFDEPSGNFQQNNYGKGGTAADYVFADAQDGSGKNNANFSSPAEGTGQKPRMQMYLWGNAQASEIFAVLEPSQIAQVYYAVQAGFGPKLTTTPITEDLVIVDDNSSSPSEGCNTITNTSELNGKIALVDRGTCQFVDKVKNAQDAGAIAVIIVNNASGNPFTMSGSSTGINIPSIMISRANGDILKNELNNNRTVKVSLYDSTDNKTFYYDSDFDNGVISHEYTHGISTRLTGGSANSNCLGNQEQMGEGWSDFFALVMTHQPNDVGSKKRGIGTYVRGQGVNGNGIRPYPYSTDMNINPVTYADISKAQFTVPHGVGSVWCSMLWDMYWSFIDEYGYDNDIYRGTGGNNIAMQLVIDGMKLQKCSPGFEDGRDAILLADQINNNGKNQKLIWEVFARRGLGYSADQGSSNSRSDGTESFDLPPQLLGLSVVKSAPEVINGGKDLIYTFEVTNYGDKTISEIEIKDTLDDRLQYVDAKSDCGFSLSGNLLFLTLDSLQPEQKFTCSVTTRVENRNYSVTEYIDSVENGYGIWIAQTEVGPGSFDTVATSSNSGRLSWFVNDPSEKSDRNISGKISVDSADMVFSFYHHYNTEDGWDGAVVEIDSGSGWMDADPYFIENGYNGIIEINPASNISGQKAFTGDSKGFIRSSLSLSEFEGKEISIRFRFVSDAAAGAEGWYIDDFALYSEFERIFNTVYVSAQDEIVNSSVVTLLKEGTELVSVRKPVGVNGKILVFPNPAKNELFVRNLYSADALVNLTDISGKAIWSGKVNGYDQVVLDLREYAEGVYFLRSETVYGTSAQQVIIHR